MNKDVLEMFDMLIIRYIIDGWCYMKHDRYHYNGKNINNNIRTFFVLLLMFMLVGCSNDNISNAEQSLDIIIEDEPIKGSLSYNETTFTNDNLISDHKPYNINNEKLLIDEFFILLAKSKNNPMDILDDIKIFLDINIKNMSLDGADKIMVEYIEYLIQNNTDIDFDHLIKDYGNDISLDIREYINLLDSVYHDLTRSKLRDTIIQNGIYIKNYPNSTAIDKVLNLENKLLYVYFLGDGKLLNIDGINSKTTVYMNDLINDRQILEQNYPDYRFTAMLNRYLSCFFYSAEQMENLDNQSLQIIEPYKIDKFECRRFFLNHYNELFKDSHVIIDEEVVEGHNYPFFRNTVSQKQLKKAIMLLGKRFFSKYEEDYGGWKKTESYILPYYKEGKITVKFTISLINKENSTLSITDSAGATFDINTSRRFDLGELLTDAKWNNIKKQIEVYGGQNHIAEDKDDILELLEYINEISQINNFSIEEINGDYMNCYLEEGYLILYNNTEVDKEDAGYKELKFRMVEK